ncbi:HAD-IA family hydrolase [Actinoplanes sp. NPDC049802]|uniref:HAD-IA family hydrolase n=1 Tax=Actinoplanes sp. NPDC049802 TaxID=3154742 RepID=UPI0033DD3C4D
MERPDLRHGGWDAVLFDVDGTLIDAVANQRRVWETWARRNGTDPERIYRIALRTRPLETFAAVLPEADPLLCLAEFQRLEDADAESGDYRAFDGAAELLGALPDGRWALVTSNYEHRVRVRFRRTGLPMPRVVIDAEGAERGKPHPTPYLLAAARLGAEPAACLVIEDSASGVAAGVAAGMTVWTVNAADAPDGSHRHFPSLAAAAAVLLTADNSPGTCRAG